MCKTVIDIQTTTTNTVNVFCGFSLLTEPPLVEENFTSEATPRGLLWWALDQVSRAECSERHLLNFISPP